jgi:uncharacterized protein YceH (UPF0502 family)
MSTQLNPVEVRVLGSLIEKEITTPDYYPLTLNALTAACNQKNNRDPVVAFDEPAVVRGLDGLREQRLISTVTGAGIRVPKYKHSFDAAFTLSRPEVAVLCLLMLRGPQTIGELRGRSGPLFAFASMADIETVLSGLEQRSGGALLKKLPRQPGRKEPRYAHLLAGEPEATAEASAAKPEAARLQVGAENERLSALEAQCAELEKRLSRFQKEFAEFKKQFD